MLKEIYINLLDQKEPKLNLENAEIISSKFNEDISKNKNVYRKIIKPSNEEIELHKQYLKSNLQKNYYN